MKAQNIVKSNLNVYKEILLFQCAMDLYLQKETFHNGIWYDEFCSDTTKELSIQLVKASTKIDNKVKLIIIGYIQSFKLSVSQIDSDIANLCDYDSVHIRSLSNSDKILLNLVLLSTKALGVSNKEGLEAFASIVPQVEEFKYRILSQDNQKLLWKFETQLSEYDNKFKYALANCFKAYNITYDEEKLDIWSERAKRDMLNDRLEHNGTSNYWYSDGYRGEAESIKLLISSFQKYYFHQWFAKVQNEFNSSNGVTVTAEGLRLIESDERVSEKERSQETIDFPRIVRRLLRATANLYRAQNVNGFDDELNSCYKTVITFYKEKRFSAIARELNNNPTVSRYNNRAFLFSSDVITCNGTNVAGQKRYSNADKLLSDLFYTANLTPVYIDREFKNFKNNIGTSSTSDNATRLLTTKYLEFRIKKEKEKELDKIFSEAYYKYRAYPDATDRATEAQTEAFNHFIEEYTEIYFLEILHGVLALKALIKQLEDWNIDPLCFPSSVKSLKEMTKYKTLNEYLTYVDVDTLTLYEYHENDDVEMTRMRTSARQMLNSLEKSYSEFLLDTQNLSKEPVLFSSQNLSDLMSSEKQTLSMFETTSKEVELIEENFISLNRKLNFMRRIDLVSRYLGAEDLSLLDVSLDILNHECDDLFTARGNAVLSRMHKTDEEIGKYTHLITNDSVTIPYYISKFNDPKLISNMLLKKDKTTQEYITYMTYIYNKIRLGIYNINSALRAKDMYNYFNQRDKVQTKLNYSLLLPDNPAHLLLVDTLCHRLVSYTGLTKEEILLLLNNPDTYQISRMVNDTYANKFMDAYNRITFQNIIKGIYDRISQIPILDNNEGLRFYSYKERIIAIKSYVDYAVNEINAIKNTGGFTLVKDIRYTAKYNVLDEFVVRLNVVESCYNQLMNLFEFQPNGSVELTLDLNKADSDVNRLLLSCRQALSYFSKELPVTYIEPHDTSDYNKVLKYKLYTFFVIFSQLHKVNKDLIPQLNKIKECALSLREKLLNKYKTLEGDGVHSFPIDMYMGLPERLSAKIKDYYLENYADKEYESTLKTEALTRDLVRGLSTYNNCIFKKGDLWIAISTTKKITYVDFKVLTVYGVAFVTYEKDKDNINISNIDRDMLSHSQWISSIKEVIV